MSDSIHETCNLEESLPLTTAITNDLTFDEQAEMSTENKNQFPTKHIFSHCRTSCDVKVTTFTWSIADFWHLYSFIDTLTSSSIEGHSFDINMRIDRERDILTFYIDCNGENQFNIHRYDCYIRINNEEPILRPAGMWKIFCPEIPAVTFYQISVAVIVDKKYLENNNTLSICFNFETDKTLTHSTMYENILKVPPLLTAMTNDLTFDESDQLVTFQVKGKCVRVKKSTCASSQFLTKLLKTEDASKIIVIKNDVAYDIFNMVIFYLETGRLMSDIIKLDEQDKDKIYQLLTAADEFGIKGLKLLCEQYLIGRVVKENVVQYLYIAINYNAKYLESYVKRLFKLHLSEIINTTEFLKLMQLHPGILFDIVKQELFKEDAPYQVI
ncbi:PREDICTED: uncharacterized protein LOC105458732 isoform X2 [Wasmannia auropunctata]|nr:PREDICTED: uncharacterized protein LOC105458732 isoform X2 [Wasmannia auropunctata]